MERLIDDGYTSKSKEAKEKSALREVQMYAEGENPQEIYQASFKGDISMLDHRVPQSFSRSSIGSITSMKASKDVVKNYQRPLKSQQRVQSRNQPNPCQRSISSLLQNCAKVPLNSEITQYYRKFNSSFLEKQQKSQEELYQAIDTF